MTTSQNLKTVRPARLRRPFIMLCLLLENREEFVYRGLKFLPCPLTRINKFNVASVLEPLKFLPISPNISARVSNAHERQTLSGVSLGVFTYVGLDQPSHFCPYDRRVGGNLGCVQGHPKTTPRTVKATAGDNAPINVPPRLTSSTGRRITLGMYTSDPPPPNNFTKPFFKKMTSVEFGLLL